MLKATQVLCFSINMSQNRLPKQITLVIHWSVSIFFVLQRLCYLAQQGQFDVDPGPEPCAQVGGAGEDVTEVLIPHELPASLLDQTLHLRESQYNEGVFHS